MKKRDVGMAKHFSKKYGNKGWAFDYPVSAIWNKFKEPPEVGLVKKLTRSLY